MTQADLISRIECFARNRGVAPATVTSRAVGNSRLYKRLKNGGSCTFSTADRILTYISANLQEVTK